MLGTSYVRFRAVVPNRHGIRPGVFALVNGLAFDAELSPAQERFRRDSNAWYARWCTDPTDGVADVYSHRINPGATSWFKASAVHLLAPVEGYLAVLRAHAVGHEVIRSTRPGRIIYEDADQVVVVPWDAAPCPACGPARRPEPVEQRGVASTR